ELVPWIHPDGAEPAQHGPRSIDVVHAPSAVPRPVMPLRLSYEVEPAARGIELHAVAERAEELEAATGQILRRWIEQRAVVRERDVVQIDAVVVRVEGRPAAFLALHAEEPAEPALLREPHPVLLEALDLFERHQHDRRVVEI